MSAAASARASPSAKGAASGWRWPGALSVSVAGPSATTTSSVDGQAARVVPRAAHSCGEASAATEWRTISPPVEEASRRPISRSEGSAPSGTRPVVKRAAPEGASSGHCRVSGPAPTTTRRSAPFAVAVSVTRAAARSRRSASGSAVPPMPGSRAGAAGTTTAAVIMLVDREGSLPAGAARPSLVPSLLTPLMRALGSCGPADARRAGWRPCRGPGGSRRPRARGRSARRATRRRRSSRACR